MKKGFIAKTICKCQLQFRLQQNKLKFSISFLIYDYDKFYTNITENDES